MDGFVWFDVGGGERVVCFGGGGGVVSFGFVCLFFPQIDLVKQFNHIS